MEQVLNLVRLNHRNSLNYPENIVNLRSRPLYQEIYIPYRRNFMQDQQNLIQYTSVDLKKKKKQVEQDRPQSKRKNKIIFGREQEMLVKKYNDGYTPLQKYRVQLPRIDILNTPRAETGSTNGGIQSSNKYQKQKASRVKKELQKKMALKARKSFRKCVNCAIFVIRLRKLAQRYLIISEIKNEIVRLSTNLRQYMLKMINQYYPKANILRAPLIQYGDIIKRKMADKSYIATEDVINNLVKLSEFLKLSSVRKDILDFLILITLENSPVPYDFFCEFQLLRLKFDVKKLIIVNVTQDQVRMIVGIFLGIKLFCNYIFYQPWNVQILQLSNRLDKKVKPIIWAYSSYFYTTFIKFFKHLPAEDLKYVTKLKQKGVKPMPVAQQNDQFYQKVSKKFKSQHQKINSNILFWLNRISSHVLIRRQKYQQEIDKHLNDDDI